MEGGEIKTTLEVLRYSCQGADKKPGGKKKAERNSLLVPSLQKKKAGKERNSERNKVVPNRFFKHLIKK